MRILHSSSHEIGYDTLTFSGGEIHFRLKPYPGRDPEFITVEAHLRSSQEIMLLAMAADALRRRYSVPLRLVCPYFPYARQDRVCNQGEALSARVMCDLINSLSFERVEIWDAHSDVVPAVLNNVVNLHPNHFTELFAKPEWIFVAPDAGAIKKVSACARFIGARMIRADKARDTRTGAILETVVYADSLGDEPLLIVDDICDGGRTFIELAKALKAKTTAPIYLYITHGIFSKGLDVFRDTIDHIYTPNSWLPADPTILTILNPGDAK